MALAGCCGCWPAAATLWPSLLSMYDTVGVVENSFSEMLFFICTATDYPTHVLYSRLVYKYLAKKVGFAAGGFYVCKTGNDCFAGFLGVSRRISRSHKPKSVFVLDDFCLSMGTAVWLFREVDGLPKKKKEEACNRRLALVGHQKTR